MSSDDVTMMDDGEGDVVYALAASPDFASDGVGFAGRMSGLYRTVDGGQSWQPAYGSLNLTEVLTTPAVVVSPDFAADRSVFAGVAGAVLRSHDAGVTWYLSLLPTPPPVVSCLAASPDFVRDGVLFAGTMEDGVFRSSDRGDHWVRWNFGLLDLHVLALAISPNFAQDDTLYVGTESGIFRSTNGGRAWREVPFPEASAPVISLAISPTHHLDGVLFAGSDSNGLYITRDRGRTWSRLGEGALEGSVNATLLASDFAVRPAVLAVVDGEVLESVDGGATWEILAVETPAGEAIVTVASPQGYAPATPLLLGLSNGDVIRVG